jgi:hypothetical protein
MTISSFLKVVSPVYWLCSPTDIFFWNFLLVMKYHILLSYLIFYFKLSSSDEISYGVLAYRDLRLSSSHGFVQDIQLNICVRKRKERKHKFMCRNRFPLLIMVVSIPIRIVVSYDFTILPKPTDTYREGILIW